MRPCVKCREVKPLDQFPKTRSNETGKEYRRHKCKACWNAVRSAKPRAYLERQSALHKAWTEKRLAADPKYREKLRAIHKSWRDRNREHVRRESRIGAIKRAYGLSPADLEAMRLAQGGLCAACGGPPDDKRPLNVDHDHTTGAVRGLLCNSCNLALGRARESVERLRALASYLEKARTTVVRIA
jgi:Autographiviridae endonuclease VII